MAYTFRRPTLDDAQALFALMSACDTAVLGRPDATIDDVLSELREPDIDLEQDAWIAFDDDNNAVGSGFTLRHGDADMIDLDIYVHPSAGDLAEPLWDRAESRAIEIGRALGHGELRLDVGVHRVDAQKRAIVEARGYSVATVFYRMRIDHTGPLETPKMPDDVRIDSVGSDDGLRRVAHELNNITFAEHFGFVPRSYDSWLAKVASTDTITWDDIEVLSVDDTPAALLITTRQYVEDENCGYVDTLGVLKEFRGRGLARWLLQLAFARDAAAGRSGTLLYVDANNVTPALGLYESVGMRQDQVVDGWRRTVAL